MFFLSEKILLIRAVAMMMTAIMTNITSIPLPIYESILIASLGCHEKLADKKFEMLNIVNYLRFLTLGAEEVEDYAAGDDRSDLTRNVNCGRVHKKEVLRILFESHFVNDSSRHREGRDTGCAYHRIHLVL